MRGCVDIYITTSTRAHLQLAPIGYYIEPKLRECERERESERESECVSFTCDCQCKYVCSSNTLRPLSLPQIVVHVVYCVLLCCVVYLLVCVVRLIRWSNE